MRRQRRSSEHKRFLRGDDRRFLEAVLWVGRLTAAILLGFGLWNVAATSVFLIHSTPATGHVTGRHGESVHYRTDSRFHGKEYIPVSISYVDIAYSDRRGQPRSGAVPEAACWNTDKTRLPIRYDDSVPPRVRVDTFHGLWLIAVVLVAAGAIGFVIGEMVFR